MAQSNDGRNETRAERLDRNWAELLQELRVTQTGVQLLTAFLLSLPFQQRFTTLTGQERVVYLVVVLLSLAATALLLAPVSMHRIVFRRHEKGPLVATANVMAQAGLVVLGLALCGVALLIFQVTEGPAAGYAVGASLLLVLLLLWVAAPVSIRNRR